MPDMWIDKILQGKFLKLAMHYAFCVDGFNDWTHKLTESACPRFVLRRSSCTQLQLRALMIGCYHLMNVTLLMYIVYLDSSKAFDSVVLLKLQASNNKLLKLI